MRRLINFFRKKQPVSSEKLIHAEFIKELFKEKNYSPELYPYWTCEDCAINAGGWMSDGHIATWHSGLCDICGGLKEVTQPRDFHFPIYYAK